MAAVEEYRCFVGGLAWATDDGRLGDAFRAFGDVLESKVINDRESGRSRGFGFVTFGDEASMRNAIDNMNGKELDGRNITVNQAQSRSGGGGGGRSNGGGGYGERSYGGGGNKSYGDRSYGERSYGNSRSEGRNGGDRGYGGGGGGGGGYGGRSGGGGGGYGGSEGGSWRRE